VFRHLLINTIASAAAFVLVSGVGFLLVPVLVASYGLKAFGLIVLARLFLPGGLLFLFDFGFSEIASQAVAKARETREWESAAAEVGTLAILALGVGAALALGLLLGAGEIAALFARDGDLAGDFASVLRVTALALPALFLATMLEGVVKGYGAFRSLRLIEVTATLAYGLLALVLAVRGWPFASIAYAFLGASVLKGALIAANALRAGLGRQLPLRVGLDRQALARMRPRCISMVQNRVLGVLQGPAQQPLIGLLVGPAGVAVFEVLTKLPRVSKVAIGLLGSALIPVAAQLDAKNDAKRVGALASWGMLLSALACIPPLAGGVLFSEPLLRLWTGPAFSQLWPWQALMFAVPLSSALAAFGATALIVRPQALMRVNAIGGVQLVGQLIFACALLPALQERAFILAQPLAGTMALAFVLRILVAEHGLQRELLWRVLRVFALGGALAVAWRAGGDPRAIVGWAGLLGAYVLWCLAYWCLAWYVVLSASERERLVALLSSLLATAPPSRAATGAGGGEWRG
jgi:O-antigen/teichoic acid export membrane protein